MSLEQIYYVGQTVAVVALVASLVFVGLQVRQNTRAQRAAARDSFQSIKTAQLSLLIADRAVADLHRKGVRDLSALDDIDRWRFGAIMMQVFDQLLVAHRNREAFGDERDLQLRQMITQPGAIAWWRRGRMFYPRSFQEEVDGWIEKTRDGRAASKARETDQRLS